MPRFSWGNGVDRSRQACVEVWGLLAGLRIIFVRVFINRGVYTQNTIRFTGWVYTPSSGAFNLLIYFFYTKSTPTTRATTYLI